jgi:7-carboxy-7-deazaguanine synthase
MDRFVNIMMWNESHGGHFRVIGQQHKWVYGPDKKEV